MSDRGTTSRRATLIAVAAVVVLSRALVAVRTQAGDPTETAAAAALAPATLPDTLSFEALYGGVGAEGVDLVWRGPVTSAPSGQATIRLEYAGAPADRRMPIWPVNAWFFFSADDYRSSFAAELSGSMNWRTGELRLTGLVTDGARRDSPVEQRMQVRRPGLAGEATVFFLPRMVLRDQLVRNY